jgi:anti-sigma-K factor RskA
MSGDLGKRERLEELLVTQAVEGLDPPEALELETLLVEIGDADPLAYEEAAAQAWLLIGEADQPMPEDVSRCVEARLSALVAGDESAVIGAQRTQPKATAGSVAQAEPRNRVGPNDGSPNRGSPGRGDRDRASGGRGGNWAWLATAAALVLAIAGWWPQTVEVIDEPQTPAEARDELIAQAPDAVRIEWDATEHQLAQGVTGHVVWSDSEQRGYMTFRNIPDNDPTEHQYQLWVFDEQRGDEYPVDGGVFDAPNADQEVVVPIRAKLPVNSAKLFAVTLEPPGGVVVSARDPILWLAERGSAESPGAAGSDDEEDAGI